MNLGIIHILSNNETSCICTHLEWAQCQRLSCRRPTGPWMECSDVAIILSYKLLTLRMRSWSKIIWDKLSHCSCWGSAVARTTPHWSRGRMWRSSPCRWSEERHWFRILKYFFLFIFLGQLMLSFEFKDIFYDNLFLLPIFRQLYTHLL